MLRPRAFTLIELLVVIAIIGVLSSVVLASLNTARVKGRDAQRVSSLKEVQTALELYASEHDGEYPNSGGNWNSQCNGWTKKTADEEIPGLVSGGYIPSLPTDSEQSVSGNTCCYLYYTGNGTSDYKFMLYNCPTSMACYNSSNNPLPDPHRTQSCAVYTPGGTNW